MTTFEQVLQRAQMDAKTFGYFLNPNPEFLKGLIDGLKVNEERYGYPACPCRLASGNFEVDRDIICPCDYRDPDVVELGMCYCGLYVRKDVYEKKTELAPVPERRPKEKQVRAHRAYSKDAGEKKENITKTSVGPCPIEDVRKSNLKMWYCKQCGYIAFREEPPYICPICKAKKEIFSEIKIKAEFVV